MAKLPTEDLEHLRGTVVAGQGLARSRHIGACVAAVQPQNQSDAARGLRASLPRRRPASRRTRLASRPLGPTRRQPNLHVSTATITAASFLLPRACARARASVVRPRSAIGLGLERSRVAVSACSRCSHTTILRQRFACPRTPATSQRRRCSTLLSFWHGRHLMHRWQEPTAGEIVWCHFPDNINPELKPRPGLVLLVKQDDEDRFFVSVAYGTSQKTNRLFSGEFRIANDEHSAACASAGLSYDTKFDLRNVLELPFNDTYFSVPPHAPHGQIPKLGTLHPSMVRIAAAAFSAASKR